MDLPFQQDSRTRQQVGSPWGPAQPQSLNRYSYVLNNPEKWTDPSGHWTGSVNVAASLFFGAGVTGELSLVFDGKGNWAILLTGGAGAYGGAGTSIGLSFTVSDAPTIHDLQGWGAALGISLGEGIIGSYELGIFSSGGKTYTSHTLGGAAGVEAIGFEIHGILTYTASLLSCTSSASCSSPAFKRMSKLFKSITTPKARSMVGRSRRSTPR